MTAYRTGSHLGTTIIREGVEPADERGRRSDDELVAVVTNGDAALAERVCELLNAEGETYSHSCARCGNHFRTPEAAEDCSSDHEAYARRRS